MRFCLSLLALCAVLVSLSGCVVVPDGYYDGPGYYYGPRYYYYHHHDWGDRGWHDRWDDRH